MMVPPSPKRRRCFNVSVAVSGLRSTVSGQVTARALMAAIDAGTAPEIVDVRSRWEFGRGHVPGARHIPFWSIPLRTAQIRSSRTSPVVLYCGHGPRAYMAGAVLRAAGFRDVRYLRGHMNEWRAARLREDAGTEDRRP
jgi:rhodanese-related sulfurtransferase